jgi:hypothetical protein
MAMFSTPSTPAPFYLHLLRADCYQDRTLGRLFIDGQFQWWTLEDRLRPASEPKVPGQTAIPAGRYRVILTPSFRFKQILPELVNVPNFVGIRMHAGNTPADTAGCILIGGGQVRTGTAPVLIHSRVAVDKVLEVLTPILQSGRTVWIEIVDPPTASLPKAGPTIQVV